MYENERLDIRSGLERDRNEKVKHIWMNLFATTICLSLHRTATATIQNYETSGQCWKDEEEEGLTYLDE